MIREIREGEKELRIFNKMEKLGTIKDKMIEEVLRQNFQATNAHIYHRCTVEQMKADRHPLPKQTGS